MADSNSQTVPFFDSLLPWNPHSSPSKILFINFLLEAMILFKTKEKFFYKEIMEDMDNLLTFHPYPYKRRRNYSWYPKKERFNKYGNFSKRKGEEFSSSPFKKGNSFSSPHFKKGNWGENIFHFSFRGVRHFSSQIFPNPLLKRRKGSTFFLIKRYKGGIKSLGEKAYKAAKKKPCPENDKGCFVEKILLYNNARLREDERIGELEAKKTPTQGSAVEEKVTSQNSSKKGKIDTTNHPTTGENIQKNFQKVYGTSSSNNNAENSCGGLTREEQYEYDQLLRSRKEICLSTVEEIQKVVQNGPKTLNEVSREFVYTLEKIKKENPDEYDKNYQDISLIEKFLPDILEHAFSPLPPHLSNLSEEDYEKQKAAVEIAKKKLISEIEENGPRPPVSEEPTKIAKLFEKGEESVSINEAINNFTNLYNSQNVGIYNSLSWQIKLRAHHTKNSPLSPEEKKVKNAENSKKLNSDLESDLTFSGSQQGEQHTEKILIDMKNPLLKGEIDYEPYLRARVVEAIGKYSMENTGNRACVIFDISGASPDQKEKILPIIDKINEEFSLMLPDSTLPPAIFIDSKEGEIKKNKEQINDAKEIISEGDSQISHLIEENSLVKKVDSQINTEKKKQDEAGNPNDPKNTIVEAEKELSLPENNLKIQKSQSSPSPASTEVVTTSSSEVEEIVEDNDPESAVKYLFEEKSEEDNDPESAVKYLFPSEKNESQDDPVKGVTHLASAEEENSKSTDKNS